MTTEDGSAAMVTFDALAKLTDVPVKGIEELRELPESGDMDGGIYFLWLGSDLQYIGKSRQICNRIVQHEQAAFWRRGKQIKFDRHTCIVVHSGRIVHDVPALNRSLTNLERAYVALYQPPHNVLYARREPACS